MADEVVREFPLRGRAFTSDNQPDHSARGEKVRAMNSVKAALQNAADKLGNEAMFLEMWRGNPDYSKLPPTLAAKLLAEDRRCFLNIYAKLLPVEVAGALDATLIVKVVTQLGTSTSHDITRAKPIRGEPVPVPALPVEPSAVRAPRDPQPA
jgi:hypothetical protein